MDGMRRPDGAAGGGWLLRRVPAAPAGRLAERAAELAGKWGAGRLDPAAALLVRDGGGWPWSRVGVLGLLGLKKSSTVFGAL